MESVEIILEGSLRKSPPQDKGIFNKFESWRDRWFVLFRRRGEQHCELFYYSGTDKKRCKGSIKLDSVEAVTVADNEVLPNVFVIVAAHKSRERKYTLIAASDEERKKWVNHLVVACGLDTEPAAAQVAPVASQVDNFEQQGRPRAGSVADVLALQSEQQRPSNSEVSHLDVLTRSRDSSPASSSTLTAGLDSGSERYGAKPEIPAKASTRLGSKSTEPVSTDGKPISKTPSKTALQPSNSATPFSDSNLLSRSTRPEEDVTSYTIMKPNPSSFQRGLDLTAAPHASMDDDEEAPTYVNSTANVAIQEEGNVYNNLPQSTPLAKISSVKTKGDGPPVAAPRRNMSNRQIGPGPDVEYNLAPRNVPTNVAKQSDSDALYNNPRDAVNSMYRMPNDQASLYNVPTNAKSPSSPSAGSSVNHEEEQFSAFNLNMRLEGDTEFGFFEPSSNIVAVKSPEVSPQEANSDYVNFGALAKPQPFAAEAESTYMNTSVLPKPKPRTSVIVKPIEQNEPSIAESSSPVSDLRSANQPQPLSSTDYSAKNFGAYLPNLVTQLKSNLNSPIVISSPGESTVKSKVQAISLLARAHTEASTTKKAGWMASNIQSSVGIRQLSIDEAPPLPSRIVAPNVSDRFTVSASFRRTKTDNSEPYINVGTQSRQGGKAFEATRNSFQNARPEMLNIRSPQGGAISESDDSANED